MAKSPLSVSWISTDFTQLNLSRTEIFAFVTYLSCIYVTQAHGSGGGSVVGAPDKIFQFPVS